MPPSIQSHRLLDRNYARHAFRIVVLRRRKHDFGSASTAGSEGSGSTQEVKTISPVSVDMTNNTSGSSEVSLNVKQSPTKPMTLAERDAALMEKLKDREGSLANTQFEDGEVEGGYRRNVKANIFRYI